MPTISSQLLHVFETEIRRIETERTRPGWTRWALVGALGTSFWFFSLQLDQAHIDWWRVASLLLAIFIVLDLIRGLDRLLSISGESAASLKIFHLSTFGLQLRRSVALKVIMYSFLVYTVWTLSVPTPLAFKPFCITIYASNCLGAIVAFASSYSSYPVPTKWKPWIRYTIAGLTSTIDVYLVYCLTIIAQSMTNLPTLTEARVAGLVAAAFWLIDLLLDSSGPHPLLLSLYEVQRSYALGQIDGETARRQFDAALTGMTFTDYALYEIVQRSNKLERETISLKADLLRLRRLLRRSSDVSDKTLAQILFRSCRDRLKVTQSSLLTIKQAIDDLPNRMKTVSYLAALTHEDVTPLIDRLGNTFNGLAASVEQVARTYRALDANPKFKRFVQSMPDA